MFKVNCIIAMTQSKLEGHLNQWAWLPLQLATQAIQPRRVLEIGFNAGHSAAAIVRGLRSVWGNDQPKWTYTTIDINSHPYTDPCFQVLRKGLGPLGSQVSNIWSPSTEALDKLIAEKASFDMIHVDGCHLKDIARSDLEQSLMLLPDGGWLRMDDMQGIGVNAATHDWVECHPKRIQGPYTELCFKPSEPNKEADSIRHTWFYILPENGCEDDGEAALSKSCSTEATHVEADVEEDVEPEAEDS
jgi:hypothetical protein